VALGLIAISLRPLVSADDAVLLRRAMLPFKTYIVGVLLVLLVGAVVVPQGPYRDVDWGRDIARLVLDGYLASSVALIVLGLVAAIQKHDRRMVWSALGYAGAGLLLAAMLWPGAFPPHTRM
jgi:hypothetical protein